MFAALLVVLSVGELMGQEAMRQVTLEEALGMAERNNPSLEQFASNVDIAGYQELTAWGSFLPNLSLSYQYSDASSGRLDPTGQAITTTSYSAQLRGSVDLFRGFRRFSDLKGARLGVEASEAAYREAEFTTSEGVKISYYNAVANRELVQVERDRVRRQEDQLAFVEQQLELGRATRSDVLRSQVDLNNAKVALLNAENSARNSLYSLAEVVGVTEPLAPVASLVRISTLAEPSWVPRAMASKLSGALAVESMTTVPGSSSTVPSSPAGPRRSAKPVSARCSRPEISAKPPLPPRSPPRALMWPSKVVVSSDQTMTSPPSPVSPASARRRLPASTSVVRAVTRAPAR